MRAMSYLRLRRLLAVMAMGVGFVFAATAGHVASSHAKAIGFTPSIDASTQVSASADDWNWG